MKVVVNIVLFLFLSFLTVPTIVSLLQTDDDDITMVYDLGEEEMQKEIKDVQLVYQLEFEVSFFRITKKTTLIKSKNLQRHDNVFGDIFLPPPEIV